MAVATLQKFQISGSLNDKQGFSLEDLGTEFGVELNAGEGSFDVSEQGLKDLVDASLKMLKAKYNVTRSKSGEYSYPQARGRKTKVAEPASF